MNDILDKVDELIEYIKTSDLYKKYQLIETQMNNNDYITQLILEIKKLQKQAVKAQFNNNPNVKELDEKINENIQKLNAIPLYSEYINTKEELNNIFLNIKNTIEIYINKKTN